MGRIKHLDPHEAQKIAAGEVVERPSSIVKELVENAIDSRATKIAVYVENGGKDLIRIIDNGFGMSSDDVRLSIEHHATSKITTVTELLSLTTFGFRGEALSSITSVSNTKIITKDSDAEHGTLLEVEHGAIKNECPIAATRGTEITVTDLFGSIPVRRKFLKGGDTEWRHINLLMQSFSLSHPSIHFTLYHNKKQIMNCLSTDDLFRRIDDTWGDAIKRQMLPIKVEEKEIGLEGFVSNHTYARYDRSNILFFVNNRWVKNYTLIKALLKSYAYVLPAGRYPVAVLFITIDPSLIDINVHPRKEEVLFLRPKKIEQLIQSQVKAALENHISERIHRPINLMQSQSVATAQPIRDDEKLPPIFGLDNFLMRPQSTLHRESSGLSTEVCTSHDVSMQESADVEKTEDIVTQEKLQEKKSVIGVYKNTYILIEQVDGIMIIDQHAAHESVLYDLFEKHFEKVATVVLLFPQLVSLCEDDIAIIRPYVEVFRSSGIKLDFFGRQHIRITATPVHLKDQPIDNLIQEVVGWVKDYGRVQPEQINDAITKKLRAGMACKAAVKAGDTLTNEQIQELLADLSRTSNRFSCPHGRPTCWLLCQTEIEKKFKRIS